MYLYNITVTVDLDIHADWVIWMRDTHIPDIMATGMFASYRMCRLMGHEHTDAEIYTTQFVVRDMAQLIQYQEAFAPALQAAHRERYEGKYAIFRTLMEFIDHNEVF